MENLRIEKTERSPLINFNASTGVLEIKGRSIMENFRPFYLPLAGWVNKYADAPASRTTINIHLEYFNTSSSKCLYDLFKQMGKLCKHSDVCINWIYEEDDEDMKEAGEDYMALLHIPFNMIEL